MIRRYFARHGNRSLLGLAALASFSLQSVAAEAQAPAAVPAAPATEPSTAVVSAPAAPEATPAPAPVAAPAAAPAALPQVTLPASVAESAPAALPVPALLAAPAEEPHARLDYSDGVFYLRSAGDNLVFVPGARMHLDTYSFAGPGVSDYHRGSNGTGLKTNLFFRRFVIEMGGIVRKKWFFWVGGNFAPTTIDANQAPLSTANVYDGFVGYMPTPHLKIYLGQYNAPVTMENVTSSRWLDFMERSLTSRLIGAPYNKAEGLMAWGETQNKSFEYQVGAFGGDGMNRPNIDNNVDGMARVLVRPLANREDALKRMHIGASGRYGWRNKDFARYDAPNLSTPGGYSFWSASYGHDAAETHVIPSGRQQVLAGEAYVPFERWDVRGEAAYMDEGRREVLASDRSTGLRAGSLRGASGYGQVSIWLAGTPRINGNPAGYYGVTKVPDGLGTQAPYALQLVLRGEMLRLRYDANDRAGKDAGGLSKQTNNIAVNVYQVALNYWATKHIRLTAEYSLYQFPGTPSTAASGADNQAAAPGAKSGASPGANSLNEFSFRVGLAL